MSACRLARWCGVCLTVAKAWTTLQTPSSDPMYFINDDGTRKLWLHGLPVAVLCDAVELTDRATGDVQTIGIRSMQSWKTCQERRTKSAC